MEGYVSEIQIRTNENITMTNKTEFINGGPTLTVVKVFLEGTVPQTKSIKITAIAFQDGIVIASIVLRFFNDTQKLESPFFQETYYAVPLDVHSNLLVPLKKISASIHTGSPVLYTLSNRSIVTVENTTGTLYPALSYTPHGTYFTLLYVSLLYHPDVQNYTAIAINVSKTSNGKLYCWI